MRYRLLAAFIIFTLAWLNSYSHAQMLGMDAKIALANHTVLPFDFVAMTWALPAWPIVISGACGIWLIWSLDRTEAKRRAQVLAEWGRIDQHRPTTAPQFAFSKDW